LTEVLCGVMKVSLAALTGEEVNSFRLEVARRMRTEKWNDSIPWSSQAANQVIMVRSFISCFSHSFTY